MSLKCPYGEKVAEKRFRRTTIEMPDELYKKIKARAIEKDMTLRQFITEALEEKLEREASTSADSGSIARSGSLSSKLIKVMQRFISPDAAVTLLIRKCEQFGYDPMYLESEHIDDSFLKELCHSMMYLANESEDSCFSQLKSAMEGS